MRSAHRLVSIVAALILLPFVYGGCAGSDRPDPAAVSFSRSDVIEESGAVELETTEPFIVYTEDRWPSSGVAVVSGKSATAAALTAVDVTRFRVSVDDGDTDRSSRYLGMHAWE